MERALGAAALTLALFSSDAMAFNPAPKEDPGAALYDQYCAPDEFAQVRALFLGDVMLGRGVQTTIEEHGGDYTFPFAHIRDRIAQADFAFANLESMITAAPEPRRHWTSWLGVNFGADPAAAPALAQVGFDAMSIANNHALDRGGIGLADSIAYLEGNQIGAVGAGATAAEARKPLIRTVNGVRVAVLAYNDAGDRRSTATDEEPGVAWLTEQDLVADIRALRPAKGPAAADVVIVSMHFGKEYDEQPSSAQRRLAERAIDAGAKLVVGHHPHVMQPVTPYGDGWIAYSLGNAVFDQSRAATRRGRLLEVGFRDGEIASICPYVMNANAQHQPVLETDWNRPRREWGLLE